MNIKALFKSMLLRKFATGLLIFQLVLTIGLACNSLLLSIEANEKLSRDVGFDMENVLAFQVRPTSEAFLDADFFLSVVDEDMAALANLEVVDRVTYTNQLPLMRGGNYHSIEDINHPEDMPVDRQFSGIPTYYVGQDFFTLLDAPIHLGRNFNEGDNATRGYLESPDFEPNIIISRALAEALYPGESAVGKQTIEGRIVGIVSDFAIRPGRTYPHYGIFKFRNMARAQSRLIYLVKVAPGDLKQTKQVIRDALKKVHPERDIREMITMKEHHSDYFKQATSLATLFSLLTAFMLLVTMISCFAHAHFHVSKQKKLIGIRRALGARKKDVLLYVLSENWLVSAIAAGLGVASVIAINMLLANVILMPKPDVMSYLICVIIVFISGTAATGLPAWKTTKIAPVTATRTL
ncbi:FtsX-like permease family protein [Pseudoalteromonas sp. Of7M-16]|uniref:ABC transporter permease n=1 Tax=Pseudoalteromonas sp. Of7M-16 TaxID=2917756 RepID=UPI001EF74FBF|nr:FtsX-like permease family protein [Pseudoalteromonas sp. Of7M-16]MCG7549557.1 FtsX-like permease family protein [Pseudoalteromonas sp. Of7M-16]